MTILTRHGDCGTRGIKMETKNWWASKTLWVSAIALVATVLQAKYGMVISPEYQGIILSVIMAILRLTTNKGVV